MATATWERPPTRRVRMTPAHGVRGLIIAAGTAVVGDHTIAGAVITALAGVTAVVLGPFIAEFVRNRRKNRVDHNTEQIEELLHVADHYLDELRKRDATIEERDAEIERLRGQITRRRPR